MRTLAGLLSLVFITGTECIIQAGEPAGSPASIIQAWMEASQARGSFQASGDYLQYNEVFREVSVSTWNASVISPTEWRWDLTSGLATRFPSTLRKGDKEFQVRPGRTVRMTVQRNDAFESGPDGCAWFPLVNKVDPRQASCLLQLLPTPQEMMRPLNWIAFSQKYPQEIAAHAVTMKELRSDLPTAETGFLLTFVPDETTWARNYRSVELIFEFTTILPVAVRILDSTGNKTTVLTVSRADPIDSADVDLWAD